MTVCISHTTRQTRQMNWQWLAVVAENARTISSQTNRLDWIGLDWSMKLSKQPMGYYRPSANHRWSNFGSHLGSIDKPDHLLSAHDGVLNKSRRALLIEESYQSGNIFGNYKPKCGIKKGALSSLSVGIPIKTSPKIVIKLLFYKIIQLSYQS